MVGEVFPVGVAAGCALTFGPLGFFAKGLLAGCRGVRAGGDKKRGASLFRLWSWAARGAWNESG